MSAIFNWINTPTFGEGALLCVVVMGAGGGESPDQVRASPIRFDEDSGRGALGHLGGCRSSDRLSGGGTWGGAWKPTWLSSSL